MEIGGSSLVGGLMVGDLVRWKPNLPFVYKSEFGIVIEIIDEYLVGVLWNGSEHVYMESIDNLEVMNDKKAIVFLEKGHTSNK